MSQKPTISVTEREARVASLLAYHAPTFKRLNVSKPAFYGKSVFPFTRNKVIEDHVALYENELVSDSGFYFELVVPYEYTPFEPLKRTLYMWKGNAAKKEEYFLNTSYGNSRWFVPVSEIQKVFELDVVTTSAILPPPDETAMTGLEASTSPMHPDESFANMTIRDYVAIKYRKPLSNKLWLNALLKKIE